jgi:hypothetical protein
MIRQDFGLLPIPESDQERHMMVELIGAGFGLALAEIESRGGRGITPVQIFAQFAAHAEKIDRMLPRVQGTGEHNARH